MKNIVYVIFLLGSVLSYGEGTVYDLSCYSCQGGPQTYCAEMASMPQENCPGRYAQCYEALVEYQNGALTLIQRRCWQPPEGSIQTDFCESFDNPNGRLKKCITCRSELCNGDTNFWLHS